MMDGYIFFKYLIFIFSPLILFYFPKAVYALWWKPKSLENYFRQIGIEGVSFKEIKTLMARAESTKCKLKPLNHAIVQYVSPVHHYMVQKYGRISLCWFGRIPRLLVADAALVKQIMNDRNGHFRKPPVNPLAALLSRGITKLEGQKWNKRRKMISPAFHHDKIMGTEECFLTSSCNLIERWRKNINVNSEAGKFELDVAPEMHYLTPEVIAGAAFGTTYEEAKAIFELQKEQVVLVHQAYLTPYFPGFRFLPTKSNRKHYELNNKIKTKLYAMILRKQRKIEAGKPDDDLLSLMLQSQKQNDMTIDDILQECKLFYFAGQDTTANLLTWTMILLAMHQDWQEKARQEVLQVFGKRTPDANSIDQLKIGSEFQLFVRLFERRHNKRMHFIVLVELTIVLHEVLRLYPPVTGFSRYTQKNTRIGDIIIPPGVEIHLLALVLHHDPEYWGENVDEFKPERFAEGVSKAAKHDQTVFLPFGWGPRICLGQNFAMLEAKIAMTMILQQFSFELSPSYTHTPHTVLTLQPKHGAQLMLHQI